MLRVWHGYSRTTTKVYGYISILTALRLLIYLMRRRHHGNGIILIILLPLPPISRMYTKWTYVSSSESLSSPSNS